MLTSVLLALDFDVISARTCVARRRLEVHNTKATSCRALSLPSLLGCVQRKHVSRVDEWRLRDRRQLTAVLFPCPHSPLPCIDPRRRCARSGPGPPGPARTQRDAAELCAQQLPSRPACHAQGWVSDFYRLDPSITCLQHPPLRLQQTVPNKDWTPLRSANRHEHVYDGIKQPVFPKQVLSLMKKPVSDVFELTRPCDR